MIRLGERQNLKIVKEVSFGIYLGETKDAGPDERVLLPEKEVPEDAVTGDILPVFVYKDSNDRMIATMREPLIERGQVEHLTVLQVNKIGAFLDWGLEKDLMLPYHEQTRKVKEGEEVLVALYVDKSKRLAATMNVYEYLDRNSPYKKGDEVEGTIYQTSDNFGIFVAVDDKYSGLVPKREAAGTYQIGEKKKFRVTDVKPDGKLDLSDRKKAYEQMDIDAESVLDIIKEDYEGNLPFDDKADPEKIREIFGLSKAAFKRAVGHLYKERIIDLGGGKIKIIK